MQSSRGHSGKTISSYQLRTSRRSGRRQGREHIRMNKPNDGYFPITSVHRADLEGLGYDVSKVDDGTMAQLADKMAKAYLDQAYWIDLPIIADHLGIPKQS
jgi:hypothetical protein